MSDNFDEFDDEFILDDEAGGGSRTFRLTAGALVGVLLISLLCYGAFSFLGGGEEEGTAVAVDTSTAATATSISATNEAVATYNSFVTQTIESMEMTANAPTATFTPTPLPPTSTPAPTATPVPTETPVLESSPTAEGDTGGDQTAGGDATPNAAATSIFAGLNTATPSSGGSGGTGGTSGGGTGGGGTTPTALPQTGISMWEGLLAAVGLLALVFVARRLRK